MMAELVRECIVGVMANDRLISSTLQVVAVGFPKGSLVYLHPN